MTGKDDVNLLSITEMNKVIEGMKKIAQRRGAWVT